MLIIKRGDPLSVANLMQAIENQTRVTVRTRRRKGDPKRLIRATPQTGSVYLITNARGTFILQRTGPHQSRVLYAFEKRVPLPASLHFEETALAAALANWQGNVEDAIARAIATMR